MNWEVSISTQYIPSSSHTIKVFIFYSTALQYIHTEAQRFASIEKGQQKVAITTPRMRCHLIFSLYFHEKHTLIQSVDVTHPTVYLTYIN